MSTWYISTTGSDATGDGSLGNPYATVGKCITVGTNNDTIKVLTGTYTITSTTNITKQVTITSNSGVNTDVIFDANCTVFNIQESNVSITYVTLQTSSTSELVSIDRMSTGTTVPTFWTGNSINHCIIKYVTTALTLNGTYSIDNNTFNRNSGSNICQLIKIYSSRGTSSISSNTFTDSEPVQYILYFTSTGSGVYFDRCNSKGGVLTIASNVVTYTHESQPTTFLYYHYFNQYNYGTVRANSQYNPNTKIVLNMNNNDLSFVEHGMLSYFDTISTSDYSTFDVNNIHTNTVDNTVYGAVHLGKNMEFNSLVTISDSDLNRPIFKIHNNTLNTPSTKFYGPFILKMNKTAYMSTGTGNPFYSARNPILERTEILPPSGFVATGVTGGVRVYIVLDNPFKFRMVGFVNYFAAGGNTIAPTDTTAGVKQANLYVTDTDPTTVYGSNVSGSDLLWSGTIPMNTGIPASSTYWPHSDINYYSTNPLFGKYIILDIVNNWGHATKVGIEKIDFVVEAINNKPVMKLPITGRYIKIYRVDDQNTVISLSEVNTYDSSNNKYTAVNGVIYPAAGSGTWQYLIDGGGTSFASTQGLSNNEYIQLDLGSMKEIYNIQISTQPNGYNQFDTLWQVSGVACQVLSDTFDILGEYEIYDSIKINAGNFLNKTIETSIWNTTISDPTSIFLKWDAQHPASIINTNNLSVSKSNQILKQWNEAKTENSNLSFIGSDLESYSIKFVVDNDNYPGILLPGRSSLKTISNGTIYYDKTIFFVFSTTIPASLRNIPFYMGSNWNVMFDANNRGTNTYSGISFGTATTPANGLSIVNHYSALRTSVIDTTTIIPINKKLVIGYKLEFVNSTTMRAVTICSLNPSTIKYTTTTTIGATDFRTNYTNINCLYCLGGRPKSFQQYWIGKSGGPNGDYLWGYSPGFYYELNIHNQLSESEMVTECQRLMTKWGVTP